jgi:hypothetical protein
MRMRGEKGSSWLLSKGTIPMYLPLAGCGLAFAEARSIELWVGGRVAK